MARTVSVLAGCYEASRAAALSGVPLSTVHYWARNEIVVPTVSPVRTKLWSYGDLMALRIVRWLRTSTEDGEIPRSPMPEVRRALEKLQELDLDLWHPEGVPPTPLLVDRSGSIFIQAEDEILDTRGQTRIRDVLDLLGPFEADGLRGPDLRQPRPHLRIVPGKCSGEPHLTGSRVTTRAISALVRRGFSVDQVVGFYPDEDPVAIREAIELERQLRENVGQAA